MSERLAFIGKIISGRGKAASHIREHAAELKNTTGEDLVEGSLNIVFRRPFMLISENAIKFDGGKRFLWIASLNGMPVWLYRWQHAPLHIAELLSTVHLRKTLSLHDGDEIRVEIEKVDVGVISPVERLVWSSFWLGRRRWCYTNDSYYFRTRGWCWKFGATQHDTNESERNLFMAIAKTLIKRTPALSSFRKYLSRIAAPKNNLHRPYRFERLSLDSLNNSEDRAFRQIQNILNYTKTSGSSYSAQRYSAGYHTIEISGRRLQGQRDPSKRLERVPVDFLGKTVLDIGCNQGGMLFQLGGIVKWGVGIDYDARMINAANRIRSLREANSLNFYVFDLEKEPLSLIEDFIPEPKVDVVFLLAVCMWLKNWRDVIEFGARISDSMVFETNGTDEQQSAQQEHLEALYQKVSLLTEFSEDDPKQKRRKLFYCDKSEQ